MQALKAALAHAAVEPTGRRWLYVPYDQLTAEVGPLSREDPRAIGIVLLESPSKAARRPYHQQKLLTVLANQRHFAVEQAQRGVAVRYEVARESYAASLHALCRELGPLRMMEAAERELRNELAPLVARGEVVTVPHEGWLTTRDEFLGSGGARGPWRMDAFYKRVRLRTGLLMEAGKPAGGKFSHDADNRKRWRGQPPAPAPPTFRPDDLTREVVALLRARFAEHPGTLDPTTLPASAADAETLWAWAKSACLPHFGPYEDAMSTRADGLFHTRVSALLNLHRVLPARVVREVAEDETLPLASREGFVRQVIGWREFVHHVHVETDGFRDLADAAAVTPPAPVETTGDGGFGRWRGRKWPGDGTGDPGARPSFLEAREPLPGAYWGDPSGLHCLDHVVKGVWQEGWGHHITRLMILSNLATLLEFDPREVTDWFWAAYVDAYDWVVEPNVLAMGTFAVSDLMTTKPYVSGAAYIHKLSDYCEGCAFDPAKNCPVTRLYWAFLARHEARFARSPRFAGPLASLKKRAPAERREDVRVLGLVRERLQRRELVTPASLVRKDAAD